MKRQYGIRQKMKIMFRKMSEEPQKHSSAPPYTPLFDDCRVPFLTVASSGGPNKSSSPLAGHLACQPVRRN